MMVNEEVLEASERHLALCGRLRLSSNFLQRAIAQPLDLRIVEAKEVFSSLTGDAKLALLDHDRLDLGKNLVFFRRRELERRDGFDHVFVGEFFRSFVHVPILA